MFKKIKKSTAVFAAVLLMSSSLSANMATKFTLELENAMATDCTAFANAAATQWEAEGNGGYYEMWFFAFGYCLKNMQ